MSLYLCIFRDGEDVDGVDIGPYADFDNLRSYVANELEAGKIGSRFPTFMLHPDSDGEWSPDDCRTLSEEIEQIISGLKERPPIPFTSGWQAAVAKSRGLLPKNAFQCFVDVDGEFVLERIHNLAAKAVRLDSAILFQ